MLHHDIRQRERVWEHETIAAELDADVYFAHPYHSWERGLNENSNGLLRQYFPKGMELVEVTQEQVQWAADRLNHRPRKVLGFRTPFEVFFGKTVRYTKLNYLRLCRR
ncbi:IS30 family transposase [Nitrosomonas sp.]|uniref:IS30 family transposase n=1 Tax=Nitrosomonas sp. TaxID=42353 RepID=UPI00374DAFBD